LRSGERRERGGREAGETGRSVEKEGSREMPKEGVNGGRDQILEVTAMTSELIGREGDTGPGRKKSIPRL
jgi:hypothetical protein